ncbi:hypothetical protein AHAS_Ahas08G0088700 [Arachis hypogaea]
MGGGGEVKRLREGGVEPEVEGEGEAEVDVEGHGEVENESEGEGDDPDHGESEAERDQTSQEVKVEVLYVNVFCYLTLPPCGSPREDKDQIRDSAPKIRDVFGDFDDDEEEDGYTVHHDIKLDSNRPPVEEKGYEKGLRPEDILADKDHRYGSEEENYEMKTKEKPLRPPLELEVPLQPPPALPEKMNMIKVSNIMGVDPKPFDRKTYVEEDTFVTDESGAKKCIHLESNIVRWRTVRNPDGTSSVSNCMQLLFCF